MNLGNYFVDYPLIRQGKPRQASIKQIISYNRKNSSYLIPLILQSENDQHIVIQGFLSNSVSKRYPYYLFVIPPLFTITYSTPRALLACRSIFTTKRIMKQVFGTICFIIRHIGYVL